MTDTALTDTALTDTASTARAVGVVLAGGSSRRLGQDKTQLRLADGATLLANAASCVASVCDVVVIADRGRQLHAGYPSIVDGDGDGPAAGILGAADAFPDRPLLVLATDLPNVDPPLLRRLLDIDGADLVCASAQPTGEPHPRPQPLCACYQPSAIDSLRHRVASGLLAPSGLLNDSLLVCEQLLVEPDRLLNINRREDFERFAAMRQTPSLRVE